MNIKKVSIEKAITPDTLRYYERIGLIPPVNRTSGGIRDYTDEDLMWVDFVKCMRAAGLSIESLIEYIRLYGEGERTVEARRNLLIEESKLLEKRISDMQASHMKLQGKINNYTQLLKD